MNTYPAPATLGPSFRTGRRYYGYQKNMQTTGITFTQTYYQNTHAPALTLQRRYYQTLSEQPPMRPRPEFDVSTLSNPPLPSPEVPPQPQPDPFSFQGSPSLDDRIQLALDERRRAEEVPFTQQKQRNYEALHLQMIDLERKRKAKQLERERQNTLRMEELRALESEQQQERSRQLSRSLQYRSTLDLQSKLQAQLVAGPKDESPFAPLVKSTFLLPRNKNSLAVDLAPLPEFQQTRYTARHPKRIVTNIIGQSPSPPRAVLGETLKPDIARFFGVDDGDIKRPMQRNMSEYGSMVVRPGEKSPFVEPVVRGVQAGFSDTRHLIN